MISIYHNKRCAKSREAYSFLESVGEEVQVIDYLNHPPDRATLKSLLKKLNISAKELVRVKEKVFQDEYKGKTMSEEDYINAMLKHPVLIERPIVVKGNSAVIGRPFERVTEFINQHQ
jgi:arsenate reductase (glutaredoxin)